MAGDWIKMRTDLYRDPKVCVMADQLMDEEGDLARYVSQLQMRDMTVTRNVMRNVTVGALVTVWGVTRHRGKRNGDDLIIEDVTLSVIDDIADLVGFGKAMSSVSWAIETDAGVVFPSFFTEFNVEPDNKAKKKNAERQRRYREKSNGKSNVTDNVTVTSRNALEKRESREEKSNPIPAASCDADGSDSSKPKRTPAKEKPRTYSEAFEQFWTHYWNKSGKAPAYDAFRSAIARITNDPAIPRATDNESALRWLVYRTDLYAKQLTEATEKLHASTYLNQDRFNDELQDHRDPEQMGYDTVKRKR